MATNELGRVGARRHQGEGLGHLAGRTGSRRTWGLIGQYALLTLLALVVLGPLMLIIIQALSPPFQYVNAGKPLHPVQVAWKDRTWFSGGVFSVVVRTFVIGFLFAWLQKVARGISWRDWRDLLDPSGLLAIVGGTRGAGRQHLAGLPVPARRRRPHPRPGAAGHGAGGRHPGVGVRRGRALRGDRRAHSGAHRHGPGGAGDPHGRTRRVDRGVDPVRPRRRPWGAASP